MATFAKIVVYVPLSHADAIREVMARCDSGRIGRIGNYDSCSFSVKGIGRFRPLKGAEPFIGKVSNDDTRMSTNEGVVEEVEEERIETVCESSRVREVIAAIRAAHPYEEPVIDVYRLE